MNVDVPTTVAIGHPEEGPNPAMFGASLVAALPAAQLLEYQHLRHFGPLQDPDIVAGDVVETIALRKRA